MAAVQFMDLSLPSSSSSSSSSSSRLLAAARALELGYAAVALDQSHRGVLADSDRCRLSSLPLPSSASFRFRLSVSPSSEPFRQYTRVTVSVDSAAAAASALAPSASRVLRTYDLVAARPLGQAAFDHLCGFSDVDIISIDFSQKLPFRLKLPMVKLAVKRGLYFEITYTSFIGDINSRRQMLSEAKLLVEWTKGKNLIISSAAHTANEIRGPYDIINLCVYLLGLSMERAKAAISTNCRSLIAKALRKKYFYKETVRIEKLLPNKQLDSTKFVLGDWIGWDPISCKEDLQPLETRLEPSPNEDEVPSSTIDNVTYMVHEKSDSAKVSLFARQPEQSAIEKELPAKTLKEFAQGKGGKVLVKHRLSDSPTCLGPQNIARDAIFNKTGNTEIIMNRAVQAGAVSSVDLKCIDEHAEYDQDAVQMDASELYNGTFIAGHDAPLSSIVELGCSALPQSMELSDICLEDQHAEQSNEIPDDNKTSRSDDQGAETGCIPSKGDDWASLDHEAPSCSDVCLEKDPNHSNDIPADTEAYGDMTKLMECLPGERDYQAHTIHLSRDLRRENVLQVQLKEENIEQAMKDETEVTEPIEIKTTPKIPMEHTLHVQETRSTSLAFDKRSDCTSEEREGMKEQNSEEPNASEECEGMKEQNSKEPNASLEKNIAKIHGPILNDSSANSSVEISTIKSENRRKKLTSRRPAYLPFLGFLKPMPFKKVCRARGPNKPV